MSHNEGPPKRLFILDFDILHPECMASEEDLAAALQVFEGSLDVPSLPHIIERALPTELALEFILSAVGDDAFCLFVEFLASEFPTSRNSFNYTSLAVQVLAALSLSLSRLDHVRDLEPANIDEYRRSIELAQRVLLALTSMLNDPAFTSRAEQPTRGQQRSRKKSRAMSRSEVMVDVKAFQNLDIKVPASREEAEELEQSILGRQREILMSLVQMVRRPEVAASIKEKYLSSSGPSSAATSPISPRNNRASSQSPTFEGSATSLPPVEMAPEIKANLQYDSPDDFGSWRIFTSERARRDFKKLGKGDARSFEIVYNKLVELSHGQFSMTNQKRINNFGSVDIFEARLPGDLRLVYQVDCIQEYKDDIPHQVLTLFGLCDHAEVSRVLWDNLSRYQALKGMEYCDACRRRKRSPSDGNEDFVPIYFTEGDPTKAQSGHADIHIVDASFKLSRADEEELHALIALGKYAKISENFWKGVLQDESVAQTHQLSHREQEIVAHTSSCYVLGRSGTGKTTTIIFKIFGLERAWDQSASHEARPRQVFVTKSRLLARKVEYEFIKLLKSDVISQHAPQHFISRAQRAPEELDEYSAMFVEPDAELPEKFSQLTDDHFPLFVTFADLCKLLEGDLLDDKQKQTAWFANQRGSQEAWSVRYKKASQDQYIKYEDFVSNYWPHFPQDLTKNHAPSYVFGQFMGVIKGSEGSLTSANSRLDRQAYERHSGGDMDYRLFEAYQRMKADRGERDVADRTHALLRALADKGVPGQMIDYLYVDEVQDNLVIDIFLMRMLCRNAGGLFWAGDTAQTISFGSAFRFTELKAIMYRYERSNRALRVSRSVKEPPTFQLLTNFRSPGGVVDCAHSVVQLLKLFPNAVDNLDKESGIINGVKPLFVHLERNLGAEKFFSAFGGSSTLYLGSNQCILVRDDEARDRLEKLYGDIGVVLTLYDSKGLEFDDILVYDFFNDSTVGSTQWRHLAEYANQDSTTSSLQDRRHAPLASELKFLYVAITRTRRNLWIVDGSDVSEHMKNFWFDLGLVELGAQDVTLEKFRDTSASQDWTKTARRLFAHGQFHQAARAYLRDGRIQDAALANAYEARKLADKIPLTKKKPRRDAYEAAGLALVDAATGISEGPRRLKAFEHAAECYAKVRLFEPAAKVYGMAEMWTEAALHFFDANLLESALAMVQDHDSIDALVREKIVNVARFSYLQQVKLEEASKLFSSYKEQKEFMVAHDFGAAHAAASEQRRDIVEAAELYHAEGDTWKAVTLLLEDLSDPRSRKLVKEYVKHLLWRNMSFGVRTGWSDTSRMEEVIATLETESVFEEEEKQTIRMFQAILSSDIDQLATLARTFTSTPLGQHDAEALMCLDCLFDDPWLIPTHSQAEVISFLELFGNYIRLLQNVIIHPAHWDSEPIKRLFCFEVAGKWTVELRKGSFLHGIYMVSTVDMGSVPISFLDLRNVLGWTLAIRLRARVEKENSLCKHIVRQFDPCYYMTVHGKCKKEHEPDFPFAHNLDLAWYNRRIEAHLRQIAVLNTSHGFLQISGRNFGVHMSEKESWLARLENALNPLLYLNGSMSLLRPSMIRFPGATEAFTVVKQWAADVLDKLKPSQPKFQPMFLTFFLSASTLGLRLDERDRIRVFDQCLPRNRCVAWPRVQYPALQIHRGQDRPPRYVLHDLVNFLRSEQDFQQGATFLRVIIQKRVPVDFGPLCDLVDRLCGLFILAHSHKTQGTLHNIILPESWIMKCWDSFAHFASHNSATVDHLVKPLRSLIEGVFTGEVSQEGLDPRYRSKELSVVLLRDVILGRLCRSLCLLGCNIQDGQLKKNICNAIASLRSLTPSANHASLHRPFLNAKGWSGLAQATRLSSRDSFDKMIQLHCSNIPETNPVPLGVLRVVYSDPNTVPALLREIDLSDSQAVSESSTASRRKHVVQVNTFYAMSTEDRLRVHEEHEEAARKIQPSCRRMLHRNHTAPTKPFPAARVRFIEACLRRCHKVAGPISPYRYIYRGILPHFILCVDWALARSTQEKARAKNERANMASLDKLSAATERQVAMNRVVTQAWSLQTFYPSSPFHQEPTNGHRDERAKALREKVGMLRTMLDSFESGTEEIEEDMKLLERWAAKGGMLDKVDRILRLSIS